MKQGCAKHQKGAGQGARPLLAARDTFVAARDTFGRLGTGWKIVVISKISRSANLKVFIPDTFYTRQE